MLIFSSDSVWKMIAHDDDIDGRPIDTRLIIRKRKIIFESVEREIRAMSRELIKKSIAKCFSFVDDFFL